MVLLFLFLPVQGVSEKRRECCGDDLRLGWGCRDGMDGMRWMVGLEGWKQRLKGVRVR